MKFSALTHACIRKNWPWKRFPLQYGYQDIKAVLPTHTKVHPRECEETNFFKVVFNISGNVKLAGAIVGCTNC